MAYRIHRSIIVLSIMLLVSAVAVTSPVHAADQKSPSTPDNTALHNITCTVRAEVPFRSGGRIYGYARRTCTDNLDVANFTVRLQRYSNGSWVNHGVAYSTSSTAVNLYVFDDAACYNRGQTVSYRTRAHQEGFHGNWNEQTRTSASFTTSCPR